MKKILPISLAVLLALSMGGNVYQYINTQALQASYTATTAQLETQTAELDRLTKLVATQAEEIAAIKLSAAQTKLNLDKATLTDEEKSIVDDLINSGLTEDEALVIIDNLRGTPTDTPSNPDSSSQPPIITTKPPTDPSVVTPPPTAPSKPAKPSANDQLMQDIHDEIDKEMPGGGPGNGPGTPGDGGFGGTIGSGGYN